MNQEFLSILSIVLLAILLILQGGIFISLRWIRVTGRDKDFEIRYREFHKKKQQADDDIERMRKRLDYRR